MEYKLLYVIGLYALDIINVRKKAKIGNRYNKVLHLTKGTIWKSDKHERNHHIQDSQ